MTNITEQEKLEVLTASIRESLIHDNNLCDNNWIYGGNALHSTRKRMARSYAEMEYDNEFDMER